MTLKSYITIKCRISLKPVRLELSGRSSSIGSVNLLVWSEYAVEHTYLTVLVDEEVQEGVNMASCQAHVLPPSALQS